MYPHSHILPHLHHHQFAEFGLLTHWAMSHCNWLVRQSCDIWRNMTSFFAFDRFDCTVSMFLSYALICVWVNYKVLKLQAYQKTELLLEVFWNCFAFISKQGEKWWKKEVTPKLLQIWLSFRIFMRIMYSFDYYVHSIRYVIGNMFRLSGTYINTFSMYVHNYSCSLHSSLSASFTQWTPIVKWKSSTPDFYLKR